MKTNDFKELEKKMISFLTGFFISFCLGLLIGLTLETIIGSFDLIDGDFLTIFFWLTTILFSFLIFSSGLKKIEEFYLGVPTILGQPVNFFIIPSGWFWQLPKPLMGFIPVYSGQRDLDIPETTALSRDLISVNVDTLVQARVTEPYNWAKTENADKALLTLVQRNLRILINNYTCYEIPGMKQKISKDLENGFPQLPVYNEKGEKIGTEELKSVKEESSMWGFANGIDKVMVNSISIPKAVTDARAKSQTEEAETSAELIQQKLLYNLLGGGDEEVGREAWMSLPAEERAKILQAERGKREIITVDGNAGDFTKGSVASSAMQRRNK